MVNHRKFFSSIICDYQIQTPRECIEKIDRELVQKEGGAYLISESYTGSLFRALEVAYPEYDWQQEQAAARVIEL